VSGGSFEILRGDAPLVLVAPHGGRRDPSRRPWTTGGLKTNDLHTASLTRHLAVRSGGSALVNTHLDRNDVDLNRISAAHDGAPDFLAALADLVRHAVARHGRATVLTIHGWNAIGPALDLGFGRRPGPEPGAKPRRAAASDRFLRTAAAMLIREGEAAGIVVTPGIRYAARARENLIQLFNGRYADDPRPLVRELALLGASCDAVQLELAIPLRFPGPWRTRFEAAFAAALPALLDPGAATPLACPLTSPVPALAAGQASSLEFVGEDLSGLVSIDRQGARLLLFEPSGRLVMCTRERLAGDEAERVGDLRLGPPAGGALAARFEGPMCAFPDTKPFLDLESGLARAEVVPVRADLAFERGHGGPHPCPFGRVRGTVTVDGRLVRIDAAAYVSANTWTGAGVRLRLDRDLALLASVGEQPGGFLCRRGEHVPLASCRVDPRPNAIAAGTLAIDVRTIGGERLQVETDTMHELPVVRGHTEPVVRIVFAACRLAPGRQPAGWCRREG
jgi:hypothetical protein